MNKLNRIQLLFKKFHIILLLLLLSCQTEDFSSTSDLENLFDLSVEESISNLIADGYSKITLTATVLEDKIDERIIIFESTSVNFASHEEKIVEIKTDIYGRARIQIVAPSKAGKVILKASVKEAEILTREIILEFKEIDPDSIFSFSVDTEESELIADGFSKIPLIATIHNNVPDIRTIIFSSDEGVFVNNDEKVAEIDVDINGNARIFLKAPDLGTDILVRATVKDFESLSRELILKFNPIDPEQLFSFTSPASNMEIPADGETRTEIKVQLLMNLSQNERSVVFNTSAGTFVGSNSNSVTTDFDGSNYALVELKSTNEITSANIKATVKGISKVIPIKFVRALPEYINLKIDAFTLAANYDTFVTVIAELVRNTGEVTPKTQVQFTASDTTGTPIGRFRDISLSDNSGISTAIYSIGETNYRGDVTIKASVGDINGSGKITVVNP